MLFLPDSFTKESQKGSVTTPSEPITKLTIGLPVYNVGECLEDFLNALKRNVRRLPKGVEVETIACVNGCTDNSEEILKAVANEALGKAINLKIVHCEKGKLNAQLKVLESKEDVKSPTCFLDTDTKPNPDVIEKLLKKLQEDANCQVSFARVEPHYGEEELTEFQDCLRVEYQSRERTTPKRYIHGRAFILRDAGLLSSINGDLDQRLKGLDEKLVHRFNLKRGLIADDIYLTRNVVKHHGVDAISEVPEAKTFFHPPATEAELFGGIRRAANEIYRMELLYPEFAEIEKLLNRKELSTKLAPRMDSSEDDSKLAYINDLQREYWKKCWDALKNNMGSGLLTFEWGTVTETQRSFSPKMEIIGPDVDVPLDKISSVHAIPYTVEGNVVAIRQNDARDWDIPGGHVNFEIDNSETDTLTREAEEEAGVVFDHSSLQRFCYIRVDNPEPVGEKYIAFYSGVVNNFLPVDLPNDEVLERRIVPTNDFLRIYGGNLNQMSEIIRLSQNNLALPFTTETALA